MGSYEKNWLTEPEWKKFMNQDMRYRDEVLIKTLYRGALRVSELVGNRNEDGKHLPAMWTDDYEKEVIDPEEGEQERRAYIVLRTQKTVDGEEEPELQPIGMDTYKLTRRYMESSGKETKIVVDNGRGSSLSRQRVNDILNEYAQNVGIDKKLGSHSLRRSRAKHLHENGMDLKDVSEFLRHNDIRTTMEYLDISKRRMADLSSQVDQDRGL